MRHVNHAHNAKGNRQTNRCQKTDRRKAKSIDQQIDHLIHLDFAFDIGKHGFRRRHDFNRRIVIDRIKYRIINRHVHRVRRNHSRGTTILDKTVIGIITCRFVIKLGNFFGGYAAILNRRNQGGIARFVCDRRRCHAGFNQHHVSRFTRQLWRITTDD